MRRSILLDAKADLLLYGNAERAIVELAHRLNRGENIRDITDLRGTAFVRRDTPEGMFEIDSTQVDAPGRIDKMINPYINTADPSACEVEKQKAEEDFPSPDPLGEMAQVVTLRPSQAMKNRLPPREKTVIRLPSFERVKEDPVRYAHANRVLHLETNPGNARALVQRHGDRDIWLNPPPIPLSTCLLYTSPSPRD